MQSVPDHPAALTKPATARHYGLDWLRIGAFSLLIFYHIGMYFVPWDWHVKSDPPSVALTYPMLALYTWRLPLLFLVSGYASRALLGKLGGLRQFVASRSKRLLIPLAFGMAVVVAPQPWVELAFKHHYTGSFWEFYAHDYFRFTKIDGVTVPTWNHLWFVAYLWTYSLMLALGGLLLNENARQRLQSGFERALASWRLFAVPLAWLLFMRLVLVPGRGETHGLFDDLPGHLLYLPCFLFGFGLAGGQTLWPVIRENWRVATAIAAAGYAVIYLTEILYPGDAVPPASWMIVLRSARVLTTWGVIVALLAFADLRLNHDARWRSTLSEAVFPCYIIHQTVIVLLGWWLRGRGWNLPGEIALMVIATSAACAAFYLGGRRVTWLRPLIGLQPPGRPAISP